MCFRRHDISHNSEYRPLLAPAFRGEGYLEPGLGGEGEQEPETPPSPVTSTFSTEEDDDEDDDGEGSGVCQIGLLERLIRTHPVWYLPGIQRAGAFHLLQGKEQGNFVVRQSSQSRTMALSVRLPPGRGPYIEHYLIEADDEGSLSLESSDNKFHSIPALVAHYSQCCDELPVELCLPRIIREARTRQQLSSLALLGQEFWRYPMANPRPTQCGEEDSPLIDSPQQQQRVDFVESLHLTGNHEQGFSSLPSSQASSLSSFGSGCSPTQEDSALVLRLAPVQQPPSLSTFKSSSPNTPTNDNVAVAVGGIGSWTEVGPPPGYPPPRAPRPTPPNTLNLVTTSASSSSTPSGGRQTPLGRTPPPPPPRSFKPPLTITTTVTFSVTQLTTQPTNSSQVGSQIVEYREIQRSGSPKITPVSSSSVQPSQPTASVMSPVSVLSPTSVLSPASVLSPTSSFASVSSPHGQFNVASLPSRASPVSPAESVRSPPSSVMSPTSDSSSSQAPRRRSKRYKESSHYRESDILESPPVFSPNLFSDKTSDYEDIWGPETLLAHLKARGLASPDEGEVEGEREERCSNSSGSGVGDTCSVPPDLLARPRPAPRPSLFLPPPPSASPTSPSASSPLLLPKQGNSPFYCEPADAIPRRRLQRINSLRNNRHSDPSVLIHWPPPYSSDLQTIDSKEELVSTSVDDLSVLRKSGRRISLLGKPPPAKHKPPHKRPHSKKPHSQNNWTIDSSWEFIVHDDDGDDGGGGGGGGTTERMFPSVDEQQQQHQESDDVLPSSGSSTLHHLITLRLPELLLPHDLSRKRERELLDDERVSAYDNLNHPPINTNSTQTCGSHQTGTDLCKTEEESWESDKWEALLDKCDHWRSDENNSLIRNTSLKDKLQPFTASGERWAVGARTEGSCTGGAAMIRSYVLQLAADGTTVFSQTIENFIRCTTESKETRPHVVMRNMRQFMSGIKNYLVKHGERDFISHVENQRAKLKANEFLNLDAILEGVLERVVVRPLRPHLQRLFVQEYSANGAIHLLTDNIHYARTKPLHHLGIRSKVRPPSEEALEKICSFLHKMQQVDSPLEKLENLLACIATIFKSVKVELGADDLLPLFAWVLVQVGMVSAEMEAEYMWGLLHPSLLSGEAGYYLTTLSSAVHVIKNIRQHTHNSTSDVKSVLRVVVPDEMNGSIITKTLPIRPHMTTRDISKIIAHKLRITNPQDYALYRLIDGEETLLNESDCPQEGGGPPTEKHCMYAYKRIDAKIAWPINTTE